MKVCTVNKSSRKAKEGSLERLGFQLLSDHFLEATCYTICINRLRTLCMTLEGILRHRTICQNYFFYQVDPEDQTHVGRLGSTSDR